MEANKSFLQLGSSRWKMRLFLLTNLPSAFFAGVTIRSIDAQQCSTSVPYKWFTKNPFRSTYFACLAMAGELSTGALLMAYLYKLNPKVSMLVTGLEAEYGKKATGRTYFQCEQGNDFANAVQKTIETGEAQSVRALTIGKNEAGEEVARFYITWSVKRK